MEIQGKSGKENNMNNIRFFVNNHVKNGWNNIYKVLKKKECDSRFLYSVKLTFWYKRNKFMNM